MKKLLLAMLCGLALSCSAKKQDVIKPVDIASDVGIAGFKFPEEQSNIYSWLEKEDDAKIASHAWGIWKGITQSSGQKYQGQDLLVYQTWVGVGDLSREVGLGNRESGCGVERFSRSKLNLPKQLAHANLLQTDSSSKFQIYETVSYNPSAACYASMGLIFNKSQLDKFFVKDGIGSIPEFPRNSITIKPTYLVTKPDDKGLAPIPVWSGTPEMAVQSGYKTWDHFVYVDFNNSQLSGKTVIPAQGNSPTQEAIALASVNLNDFIHFTLDQDGANYLNGHQDQGSTNQFKVGDHVLLVAMHLTSKEIPNWTWQTYWWSPDSDNPPLPSSKLQADQRPKELTGAARHYAVSSCSAMVYPNQPISGGTSGTKPIICFNPYLEAGFGPKVFSFPNRWKPEFQYGVQTNCASCHALATRDSSLGYSTDQYIDMKDSRFNNDVQLDFTWSIQGNINKDK